jgi:hypothetical protein
MSGANKSFAEIVESSLEQCTAQSWQWDTIPAFGSLVTIQNPDHLLLGVVHTISIGSSDAGRTPFTYQKTPEELLRDQPHIFAFLKTTFSCLIVGYVQGEETIYTLAPRPAHIHAFVQLAAPETVVQFFATASYVHCLFGVHGSIALMDELLLALLKQYQTTLSRDALHACLQAYMLLVGNDYRRMRLFAHRVSGFMHCS